MKMKEIGQKGRESLALPHLDPPLLITVCKRSRGGGWWFLSRRVSVTEIPSPVTVEELKFNKNALQYAFLLNLSSLL